MTATAQVAAHLKPRLAFGASIADQTADIYLELDAYAELDLSLTGAASGSVSTTATTASTGAGGCVDILAGLGVNAGADADLLGLFNASDTVSLYDKSFDLFNKCFGDDFQKRGYRLGGADRGSAGRRRGLGLGIVPRSSETTFSCPTSLMNGWESTRGWMRTCSGSSTRAIRCRCRCARDAATRRL